jgi:glycosyltransferase involved in cell wall biosynthesis
MSHSSPPLRHKARNAATATSGDPSCAGRSAQRRLGDGAGASREGTGLNQYYERRAGRSQHSSAGIRSSRIGSATVPSGRLTIQPTLSLKPPAYTMSAPLERPRERIKVLLVVDRLDHHLAGAERLVLALATHLPQDRFDVWVCTTRFAGGPPMDALAVAGVTHVHLDRQRRRIAIGHFRDLVSVLRRERFDVLHSHMFGSNVWGTLFGTVWRIPVVIAQEQTWSYEGQPLRRFLDGRFVGRLATAFVAVSTRDRDRMISIEKVPPSKIVVIPNAYIPRPDGGLVDLRAELGIPSGVPVVGTVAIFRPQKALDVLVDAFAIVRRSFPDARLVLVGGGKCRPALEQQVERLGLTGHVHMPGRREDVASVWAAVDIAAMSSDFEGTPLAALEALAHGVPLVATDVGGLPDIIGDENGGVLVPARDPPALAGAIEDLLRDPDRRARLAREGRARAREFAIEIITARFADLYDHLLRNGQAAADIR